MGDGTLSRRPDGYYYNDKHNIMVIPDGGMWLVQLDFWDGSAINEDAPTVRTFTLREARWFVAWLDQNYRRKGQDD